MPVPYSIANDRMPPEEYANILAQRYGPQDAPGAWPKGTRILVREPPVRGRIEGSYGPCRAPHADEGKPAPIPHFHYFARLTDGARVAVRSDLVAGHS